MNKFFDTGLLIMFVCLSFLTLIGGVSLILQGNENQDLKKAYATLEEDSTKAMWEAHNVNEQLMESNRVKDLGKFRITYYCNNCAICGTNNVTSDGSVLTEDIQSVAVDPSVVPYGTILIINGDIYLANDKGGAIRGNEIDIMVYGKTHEEVLKMGVKFYDVYSVKGRE